MATSRDTALLPDASASRSSTPRTPPQQPLNLGISGLANVARIRAGATATVYQALQTSCQRSVAVKVIHRPASAGDAQGFDPTLAFERARTITGQLSGHAAIVPVLETGVTAHDEPYLVTPYYGRGSLGRLIAEHGPLAWQEATFLIEGVAVTLAEVHGWGVVHRNITPATIMLTDFLLPRVGEFEMSLPIGSPTVSSITFTPCYSPPEAVEPVPAEPTVDVYGLGAVLWALLAGRPPFTNAGERIDALTALDRARGQQLAPPTQATPEPIVALLRRAMAPEPARRPANGAAFVTELRRAVSRSESAPPPEPTERYPALVEAITGTAPAESDGNSGDRTNRAAATAPNGSSPPAAPTPPAEHRENPTGVGGDARYILLLVAMISLGVLGMVIAAMLTGN